MNTAARVVFLLLDLPVNYGNSGALETRSEFTGISVGEQNFLKLS
jgi:hypothetical protein